MKYSVKDYEEVIPRSLQNESDISTMKESAKEVKGLGIWRGTVVSDLDWLKKEVKANREKTGQVFMAIIMLALTVLGSQYIPRSPIDWHSAITLTLGITFIMALIIVFWKIGTIVLRNNGK